MKGTMRFLWVGLFVSGLAAAAGAQTAFSVNDPDSDLYEVDLATGNISSIGDTGFGDIEALAFDPTGAVLYAIEDDDETLMTCSTATGACSIVGPLGLGGDAVSGAGMAFTCDGRLFMVDEDDGSEDLVEIDPATGAANIIGDLGTGIGSLAARRGDARCPSGLFGVNAPADTLYCIDVATGAANMLAALSTPFANESAIEFASDGTLWIIEDGENGGATNIGRINPATGAVTDAGYDLPPSELESLAIASLPQLCQTTSAPAVSPWGLGLIVVAVIMLGYRTLRRPARS